MTAAEIAAIRHGLSVTLHGRGPYAPRARGRYALRLEWNWRRGSTWPSPMSVDVFRYGRQWQIRRNGRVVEHGTFGAEIDTAPIMALLRRAAGEMRPVAPDVCACGHAAAEHYVSGWPACSECTWCGGLKPRTP